MSGGWALQKPGKKAGPEKGSLTHEEVTKQCLESGKPWEDPDFPACDDSLYYQNPPDKIEYLVWKRPSEICDDPRLFVGGTNRMDVVQGVLGDCWFLAAAAALATNKELIQRVVPHDQSLMKEKGYTGMVRFNFWRFGRWTEVLVDDRLPVNRKTNTLMYMHSCEKNEFWSALLEKAAAKLVKCYESLDGGQTIDALTDFTGGLAATHKLGKEAPKDLMQIMLKAQQKGALMGCSIDAGDAASESELPSGLLVGHAYSITDVRMISLLSQSQKCPMVRVRNPWADKHEWKYAWSDNSKEWKNVSDEEKKSMNLASGDDGEFWMSFDDFVSNFSLLEICFLGPDSKCSDFEEIGSKIKWESTLLEGCWRRKVNAGGRLANQDTFWTNPQFRVAIEDADSGDDEDMGTIIVGLMQKNRRAMRREGKENLTISYYIYKVDDNTTGNLDSKFFKRNKAAAQGTFCDTREASLSHKLPPGNYVIIPATYDKNEEAEFVLRIFSERKGDQVKVVDSEISIKEKPKRQMSAESTAKAKVKELAFNEAYIALSGRDGAIDGFRLQNILNEAFPAEEWKTDGFSLDMARSLVALKDASMTGRLSLEEFRSLWTDVAQCVRAFKKMDEDGNGTFNSYELRNALNYLGLSISNAAFAAVAIRFSDKEGLIRFDDFIQCYIRLKAAFEAYRSKDPSYKATASFSKPEFLEKTVYAS